VPPAPSTLLHLPRWQYVIPLFTPPRAFPTTLPPTPARGRTALAAWTCRGGVQPGDGRSGRVAVSAAMTRGLARFTAGAGLRATSTLPLPPCRTRLRIPLPSLDLSKTLHVCVLHCLHCYTPHGLPVGAFGHVRLNDSAGRQRDVLRRHDISCGATHTTSAQPLRCYTFSPSAPTYYLSHELRTTSVVDRLPGLWHSALTACRTAATPCYGRHPPSV